MNQTIGQRRTLHGFNHRPRRNVRRRRRAARAGAHVSPSVAGAVARFVAAAQRYGETGWVIAVALACACVLLGARIKGYIP